MLSMIRGRKGETKLKILKLLASGPKSWNFLKKRLKVKDSTLYRHLADLMNAEFVSKDEDTKNYILTDKGGAYLMHMGYEQLAINHPDAKAYYFSKIKPKLDVYNLIATHGILMDEDLPIPLPYEASLIVSKEISFVIEDMMYFLRWHENLSDREAELQMIEGMIYDVVRPFLWDFIWNNILGLMNWHINFKECRTDRKPPLMTIDEILNFHISLMINFNPRIFF